MLYRWVIQTRTTHRKLILGFALATDGGSILIFCFGLPLFFEATEVCDLAFSTFLFLLAWYCLFAVIRLGIVLGHFIYGPRFWSWVKRRRCCRIFSVCEYEQRVDFDIYNAKEYVHMVNRTIQLTRQESESSIASLERRASLKVELKFEDLTCAICLDGFQENQANQEQTSS